MVHDNEGFAILLLLFEIFFINKKCTIYYAYFKLSEIALNFSLKILFKILIKIFSFLSPLPPKKEKKEEKKEPAIFRHNGIIQY